MYDEDAYTSLCPLQDIDYLKEEYAQDEILGTFYEDPSLTINHLSKYELCEMREPLILILDNRVKRRSDYDGVFGYVVIEYFLKSIKKESVQVETTNRFHSEIQRSLDHNYGNELIGHSICPNCI